MRELIGETNSLTDLKDSLQRHENDTLSAELESKISTVKHQIYLTCFLMVFLQWMYTNAINIVRPFHYFIASNLILNIII